MADAMRRHVKSWDVRDVCHWVEYIGLGQYRGKFLHNRQVEREEKYWGRSTLALDKTFHTEKFCTAGKLEGMSSGRGEKERAQVGDCLKREETGK